MRMRSRPKPAEKTLQLAEFSPRPALFIQPPDQDEEQSQGAQNHRDVQNRVPYAGMWVFLATMRAEEMG